MKKFLIINGPNLNLLGEREKDVYGNTSLAKIEEELKNHFSSHAELTFYQSNIEGELVSKIQEGLSGQYAGIVINPGGYTHTSVAILDAIRAIKIPVVEVHLSNISDREDYRHKSITGSGCLSIISGGGKIVYRLGLELLLGQ